MSISQLWWAYPFSTCSLKRVIMRSISSCLPVDNCSRNLSESHRLRLPLWHHNNFQTASQNGIVNSNIKNQSNFLHPTKVATILNNHHTYPSTSDQASNNSHVVKMSISFQNIPGGFLSILVTLHLTNGEIDGQMGEFIKPWVNLLGWLWCWTNCKVCLFF